MPDLSHCVYGGQSAMTAEVVTPPIKTAKTDLQLLGQDTVHRHHRQEFDKYFRYIRWFSCIQDSIFEYLQIYVHVKESKIRKVVCCHIKTFLSTLPLQLKKVAKEYLKDEVKKQHDAEKEDDVYIPGGQPGQTQHTGPAETQP